MNCLPVRPRSRAAVAIATAVAGLISACDRPPPASQPAAAPAAAAEVVHDATPVGAAAAEPGAEALPAKLLDPVRAEWSREEALARLGDPAAGLSAAIRLIELSGLDVLVAPPEPGPAHVQRLALARLGDDWTAVGLSTGRESVLASPVLITGDGDVRTATEGIEEELSRLIISSEPVRFPHVIVTPEQVLLVTDEVTPALVADRISPAWFDVAPVDGRPVVVARLPGVEPERLTQYRWDVVEEMFLGPMRERLADGQGWIELNATQSIWLVPIGGELPEPPPLPDPEDFPQPQPQRMPL